MFRFRALFARSWTAGLPVLLAASFFPAIWRPTAAADPTAPQQSAPSDAQIAEWVKQLSDASFQRREAAMELLNSAGIAAVDELAAAATDKSPEVAWRAAEVMERIAVLGDEQEVECVIQVMQQLAETHPQFAQRAVDLKSRWREQRHARAAARLAELGARLHENAYNDWLSFSPAASPLFLMPDASVEVFDDADVVYSIEGLVVDEIAEPAEESREDRDLGAVTTVEIEPALERAMREEAPEMVRTEKVVVDDPASDKPTPAESADPTILEPVAEDVPGTESFAGDPVELLEGAGEELELDGITIDTAEVEAYDLPYVVTAIDGGGFAGFGEGRSLEIGPGWKGTDDDLRLLRDLNGVKRLTVCGRTLSESAFQHILEMKQLQRLTLQHTRYDIRDVVAYNRQRPEVAVQAMGPGVLGVSGEPVAGGVRITHLVAGSGAARAGIRTGDVLTRIDGQPLADFDMLSWIVASRRVGEVLKVETRCGEKTFVFAVKLGGR